MGSMSPSSTIHLGKSVDMLARSRMMEEKRPVQGEEDGEVRRQTVANWVVADPCNYF